MENGKKFQLIHLPMNKILELIEAQKLFNIPFKKLEILIHPESLVHAIVVLNNGLTSLSIKYFNDYTNLQWYFDDKVDINDFTKIKQIIRSIV